MKTCRKMIKKLFYYSSYLAFPVSTIKALIVILLAKINGKEVVDEEITFSWDGQLFCGNPASDVLIEKLYLRGFNEFVVTQLFNKYLREGMTVVDAGAHMGWSTLLICKRIGKSGRVIAFEPAKKYRAMLVKNIELNNYKNIEILDSALFDVNKRMKLSYSRGMLVSPDDEAEGAEIVCQKLDSVSDEYKLSRIDLIKIDIEGSEMNCLLGMEEVISKFNPILIIEVHPEYLDKYNFNPKNIITYLKSKSYKTRPFGIQESQINSTREIFHMLAIPYRL